MALSVERYRQFAHLTGMTQGQAIKRQSDMIMEATWDRDLQSRIGYIYDYFSDDSVGTIKNLQPQDSVSKSAVEIKFIVSQHGSLNKDQVEYKLQFKPSHKCPLAYYQSDYDYKYGMEYPVGMYIDIPDEGGVYRKWLICSKTLDPQFITYSILPCNYTFRWVHNGKTMVMDGVARLRNSYNSGIWTDYLTTTVENQDQLWLPLNDVSTTIFYNQRFLISAPIPTPIAWRTSKIETIHPIGIYKVVVAQDLFDAHRDYVDLERNIMIADYYKSAIEPAPMEPPTEMVRPMERYTIESSSKFAKLRINGSPVTFRFAAWDHMDNQFTDEELAAIYPDYTWSFYVDNIDVADRLTIVENPDRSVSVSTEDLTLMAAELVIELTAHCYNSDESIVVQRGMEVVAL